MSNEWMLDVIADLRTFADLNGMTRLSDELARASGVAHEEISKQAAQGAPRHEGVGRTVLRPVVGRQDA